MTRKVDKFLKDGRGRIPVLILAVVAAIVTVSLVAAQPWAGGDGIGEVSGPAVTATPTATATPLSDVPWWCEYWEQDFPDECATPVATASPTYTPGGTNTPQPTDPATSTPTATPTKNPATVKVIIGGGTGGGALSNASVTEWVAMFGTAVYSARDDAAQVMPFAGYVSQLAVRLSNAPGSAGLPTESYTFTLYVDGADTDVGGLSGQGGGAGLGPGACVIEDAGSTCEDKIDSVCVDKDQLIAIQATGKEVATGASMVWTAEVTPIVGSCPGG